MKQLIGNICKSTLLLGCLCLLPMACSDDDEVLSDATKFGNFSVENATVLRDDVNQTLTVVLPEDTKDASAVDISFSLPEGAVALVGGYERNTAGKATVDLSRPMKFIVEAANGDRANWTVIATNNSYTLAYGMGYMLTGGKSLAPARGGDYSPYCNQYENTPAPNNNCGPACAAMAVNWGHTRAKMTPEMARSFNTAQSQWNPGNCRDCINMYGGGTVHAAPVNLPFHYEDEQVPELYARFLKETIDAGKMVLTVLNNGDNTYNANPGQHTHRFYQSNANHIMLYKGYRVVDGVTWIEVYDPAGAGSDAKYADGSWKGENRYYLATDLAKAIKNKQIGIVTVIWHD